MPDLLLELLSEEIPAGMQEVAASEWLRGGVRDALCKAGLLDKEKDVENYWTPRRLVLHVRGLAEQSSDIREERKGPRFDAPQKAIDGFRRSAELDPFSQVQVRNDPKKGKFYVALIERPGRKAEEIIAEILPGILRDFRWRKSMRWGEASSDPGSFRWIRPLRSILCILNDGGKKPRVVEFEVGGIRSGGVTQGHRFRAPKPFAPSDFDDYVKKLKDAEVILDHKDRKETILSEARRLCSEQELTLLEDDLLAEEIANLAKDDLLAEKVVNLLKDNEPAEEIAKLVEDDLLASIITDRVEYGGRLAGEIANLVEWPVVLLGSFPERYLLLPDEVIRLTIAIHQKCFVMRDSSGKLAPRFILVSNIKAKDGGARIIRGNERVVAARLADAKFFWESDLRTVKSSDGFKRWISELDRVVFYAGLGSQGDRVQRIEALAEKMAKYVGADPVQAKRAAHLAKADLQSAMVSEFPELQGKMGRLYAEAAGEDEDVALAIEEHYKPLGPFDSVPKGKVSVAVALADKIDTLVGFWSIGKKPTGSGDPFGLRRAALGILHILGVGHLAEDDGERNHFSGTSGLLEILSDHATHFTKEGSGEERQIALDLLDFIRERLKIYLKGVYQVREDFTDAAMASQNDDLFMVARKARAMRNMLLSRSDKDAFMNLLSGYRRATNILDAEGKKGPLPSDDDIDENLFERPNGPDDPEIAELSLLKRIQQAKKEMKFLIDEEEFEQALVELSELHNPIERFFEEVLVNTEDKDKRANRLKLLARLRDVANEFADFSKVQE